MYKDFVWSKVRELERILEPDEILAYGAIRYIECKQDGKPPTRKDVVVVAGKKVGSAITRMMKKGWFPDYGKERLCDLTFIDKSAAGGQMPGPGSQAPQETLAKRSANLRRLVAQKAAKGLVEALREHMIKSGCESSVFTFHWMLHERRNATSYLMAGLEVKALLDCMTWVFTDPGGAFLAQHCTSMQKVKDYLPRYQMRGKKPEVGQGFIGAINKHKDLWDVEDGA